ncbi:MAG: transglycosylase domain-containing protein, partial [Candidatus Eisenbacteria bacterium]|nr:transglycosylase domain-containing protein [Candidatus Eisenbacteria bacterium]
AEARATARAEARADAGVANERSRWSEKWLESFWALVLEARLTKREILELYLNRAPYGPTLRGAEAAARAYFDHGADSLTWSEAALLAALPQSPVRLDPRRAPEEAMRARDRLIARLPLSSAEKRGLAALDLPLAPLSRGIERELAPHWLDRLRARFPEASALRLPLERELQTGVEQDLRATLTELRARGADDGAVLVIDNPTGEVRAWVGSPNYADPRHGQFDAVLARRQPGSALKPFAYALAFEEGLRPASLLPDLPLSFPGPDGTFTPGNYAGAWHGPVRARAALANSWNAPAVALVASLGPERFLARLRALGLESLDQPAVHYGLGLALGVGEVTLLELTGAYATLARGGIAAPRVDLLSAHDADGRLLAARTPLDGTPTPRRRVMTSEAAFFVQSILSDPAARAATFGRGAPFEFPFPCAIKTGTSSDWRDNWAFGFTAQWTVGVWIGRAGGEGMDRVSGTEGAILALRRVLLRLQDNGRIDTGLYPAALGAVEEREICPLSGQAAGADCPGRVREWFARSDAGLPTCAWHRRIPIDRLSGGMARVCTPDARVAEPLFTLPLEPAAIGAGRGVGSAFAAVSPLTFHRWARDQEWPRPPTALAPCLCGQPECGPREGGAFEPAQLAGAGGPFRRPPGRASSAALAAAVGRSTGSAAAGVSIVRPVNGSIYALDPSLPRTQQAIALEAVSGDDAVRWSVNDVAIGESGPGERLFWPLEPGRHRIRAERLGAGRAIRDEVRIEVEP